MSGIRRVGIAAGMAVFATAMLAGPAGADTPEAYAGTAAGQALALSVSLNGQGTPAPLTFGISDASADSNLNAKADAAGELLQGTLQTAKVQGDNSSQQNPQQCGPLSLPNTAPFSTLGLSFSSGCSASVAQVAAKAPSATGSGTVAGLDLDGSTILNATPIGSTLTTVLNTIVNAIPGGTPLDPVKSTVGTVVGSVLTTKTLSATVGSSTSSVTTVASTVTSTANAAGAVIKILPNPTNQLGSGTPISSDPLATITVGKASATAVYNRQTGQSTDSFSPALVTVHFNPDLAKTIPGLPTDISVPVNQTQTILQGTPLESKIIVGDGSTVKNADGSVGATADGVRLELLRDPGDTSGKTPLLTLSLAHAQAGVGGTPAVVSPVPVAAPATPELPRTGGTPWIPMAGVGVAVLAFLARRAKSAFGR